MRRWPSTHPSCTRFNMCIEFHLTAKVVAPHCPDRGGISPRSSWDQYNENCVCRRHLIVLSKWAKEILYDETSFARLMASSKHIDVTEQVNRLGFVFNLNLKATSETHSFGALFFLNKFCSCAATLGTTSLCNHRQCAIDFHWPVFFWVLQTKSK